MSNSFQPHVLQHIKLPCPSLSPGVCPNSCPLSWWYHPTISSSAALFSSCLQFFPAPESFPMSQLFSSCGQSIGVSALVLPINIQGWFPLGLTGLISLLSRDSEESSSAPRGNCRNQFIIIYQTQTQAHTIVLGFWLAPTGYPHG